jgi:hypothetical protein
VIIQHQHITNHFGHTLSTKLEELQQEINVEKGNNFCKDEKLLTKLFRAAEATTNEAFALDTCMAKNAWITGKQTDKNAIINNLNVLYQNMVAEGSWKKTSTADSKSIALTTQVANLKKKLGENDSKTGKKKERAGGTLKLGTQLSASRLVQP